MLMLMLVCVSALAFEIQSIEGQPKTIYVDDDNTSGPWYGTAEHPYRNITRALERASAGDAIYVYNGTYYENVLVEKSVSLLGEAMETTIIDGGGRNIVIDVEGREVNVTISGFTIRRSGTLEERDAGIKICRPENPNTIRNNNITNNACGIILDSCERTIISGNNITNSKCGVYSIGGVNSKIDNNKIVGSDVAIKLELFSSNNDVVGNYMEGGKICGITSGIWVKDSKGNTLSNNTITTSPKTLPLVYGILLENAQNSIVAGNNVSDCTNAVTLNHSDGSFVVNNNIKENANGIKLLSSANNGLGGNCLAQNRFNFGVSGDKQEHFINTINTSNTVDGRPIYYWVNQSGKSVPNDAGYVGIVCSKAIEVKNLNLMNNCEGVLMAYSNDSVIENVTVSDNRDGIAIISCNTTTIKDSLITDNYCGLNMNFTSNNKIFYNNATNSEYAALSLYSSNDNEIKGNGVRNNSALGMRLAFSHKNTISSNNVINNSDTNVALYNSNSNIIKGNNLEKSKGDGVFLVNSNDNRIYWNNFANNSHDASCENSINAWDNGYPRGGNYWDSNPAIDNCKGPNQNEPGSDRICDQPYNGVIGTEGNQDRYPFAKRRIYPIPPRVDINHDGRIDILDLTKVAIAVSSTSGEVRYNINADLDLDGRIIVADVTIVAMYYLEL
jgi:parallel beta-helix repeat protein